MFRLEFDFKINQFNLTISLKYIYRYMNNPIFLCKETSQMQKKNHLRSNLNNIFIKRLGINMIMNEIIKRININ